MQLTVKLVPPGTKLNTAGASAGLILKLVVVEQPPAATIVALYKPGAIPPVPDVCVALDTPAGIGAQFTV